MISNWIKIFLFQIKDNKFFTVLNVLGLSLGISGLIFSVLYWNDENSYNQWNTEKDMVVQVVNNVVDDKYWPYNVAPMEQYIKEFEELDSYCFFMNYYSSGVIQVKNKKEYLTNVTDAQKTFFEYFPFEFIEGSSKTALQDVSSIALEYEVAKKLFGDKSALGQEISYSGETKTIRGVYKIPGKSSIAPSAVVCNIYPNLQRNHDSWGNFNYGLMLKLKNTGQKEVVSNKIQDIFLNYYAIPGAKEQGITLEEFKEKYGLIKTLLEPLTNARLHSLINGYPEGKGNYEFLVIMLGLSVLIMILSIVNYVNLATANAIKRAKEVGVRKIIGASKGNIILQFIFETVITTLISILIALVIVELTLPFYNNLLNKTLVINGSEFIFQLFIIFFTVVTLAGIFPAVYVSNFRTLNVLKGNFGRSKSGVWLRNSMLVLQFAIASFFIIGSYIVYTQVDYMNRKDLGFSGDKVIQINYNSFGGNSTQELEQKYENIKTRLLNIKGVKSASIGVFRFGKGANSSSSYEYNNIKIQPQNIVLDFDLLDMLNIEVVAGRNLSTKYASDTINSILVNETALSMMKEKEPIGKTFLWMGIQHKIAGVVKDFQLYGPKEKIPPMTFFHYKNADWMISNGNSIYVKIDGKNIPETIDAIEKFWVQKVDNLYPFRYDFVDKQYARTFDEYTNQRNLFTLLNCVVILIALFGLFSLASFSIQRRMKEIAIRKTLGAETGTLLKELSRQYIIFCCIGFIIAIIPAYFLLEKWLQNFAYRIDISAIPFITGFFALLILTLIVVLSKAYQATKIDVLKYLKYE